MPSPSRTEFDRLKAQCERILRDVSELREQMATTSGQLRVQFQRIAEIQAVLGKERIAGRRPEPRPLIRQHR